MRNLTITRRKNFIGCLAKTRIYMCDPNGTENIKGKTCTKMGDVINDGILTFDIPTDETRIYATTGVFGKKFYNELYVIPEGEEDVNLKGGYFFDAFAGATFRFINNTNKEALLNRVENKKKARPFQIIGALVGLTIGVVVGYYLGQYVSYMMF